MDGELYQQVILEHNRKPRNFGEMQEATHSAEGYNPLCGDHLWIYLHLSPDGQVDKVSFKGDGCAISKASASLMTTAVKGKTKAEALDLIDGFQKMVKGDKAYSTGGELPRSLQIFSSIWKYPSRVKCAVLAWRALEGAMQDAETVTTES